MGINLNNINNPTPPKMNKFIGASTTIGGTLITVGLAVDSHTLAEHPLAIVGVGVIVLGSLIGILWN